MTVLLISNHCPPVVDGVGDYTWRLAQALAENSMEVHVLCRNPAQITAGAGFTVHTLQENWGAAAVAPVRRIAAAIQPDWIGLQYVPYGFHPKGVPAFLPGLLRSLREKGVRLWTTFHEIHIRLHGWRGWILGQWQRRIARAICREMDLCVTSIPFYRQLLLPFHPDVRVIPVGSNIWTNEHMQDTPQEEEIESRPFTISTFGKRNLKNLMDAVHTLHAQGRCVRLLVCGQTAEGQNDWADSAPEGIVSFTGYLPSESLGARLRNTDLFVLPDYLSPEGEGGTCLKSGSLAAAYAAGLPVLGVRGDMTGEPLRHGENIWLVRENSTGAWADAIRHLTANPGLLATLRQGSRYLYETQLAWTRIGAQYRDFLTEGYVATHS